MAVTIAVRTAGAGSFVSWAFRNPSAARLRTSSRAERLAQDDLRHLHEPLLFLIGRFDASHRFSPFLGQPREHGRRQREGFRRGPRLLGVRGDAETQRHDERSEAKSMGGHEARFCHRSLSTM